MKKKESNNNTKDIFGEAIKAFYYHKDETNINVHSQDFDDDIIPVHYLFRTYSEMPVLERKALDLCKGKILDVGCGAGSHALYLQDEKQMDVTGIDISSGAIEIAAKRGLKKVRIVNYFDLKEDTFDTILFLMNGTGIIEKLDQLDNFFNHTKTLLAPGGSIFVDSSDLRYLFDEDEDGGIWVNTTESYYGELRFSISYKKEISAEFNWLYLDFNMLELAAAKNGFSCKLVAEGTHYDYLAQLKLTANAEKIKNI